MKNKRKGFTLIEMLIVIAIIGILASIVLIGLGPVQRRGRDARRQADLRQVQNALELYFNKFGHYPGNAAGNAATGAETWDDMSAALIGASIGVSTIPTDPTVGKVYDYKTNSSGSSYVLRASLEDTGNPALNNRKDPDASLGVAEDCSTATYYCVIF